MSSSYNCQQHLMELAAELHKKAYDLEEAARVLETLRNSEETEKKIKEAKDWAKSWMNR